MVESTSKSLVGCELVLDPKMSGMFQDPVSKVTLNFFGAGKDRAIVTKDMDTKNVVRNIKAGVLRVVKGGKDVSKEFGGTPEEDSNWHFKPIVAIPALKKVTDKDKPLIQVLDRNNDNKVIQDINSINDFNILSRLLELEKAGKNPASHSRASIIEALEAAIEKNVGMSEAGKIDENKKDVVKLK